MDPRSVWVLFFAGLVSIKAHPRNEGGPDLDECAVLADEMMEYVMDRFGPMAKEDQKCGVQ